MNAKTGFEIVATNADCGASVKLLEVGDTGVLVTPHLRGIYG